MRVQLSENSKAEFIELINKDSITCWFDGDEFVMPSGQGKTAKGIVLGKLLVWQHQQSKIDELQKKNAWLSDVAERENKRANKLQEEKVSTTTLLGKTIQEKNELQKQRDSFIKAYEIEIDKSVELQKRVDAALQLVNEMKGKRYPFSAYADQLEQALKGGGE